MNEEKSQPLTLQLDVAGDRRAAENVILEVRAVAERLGLNIADIQVTDEPAQAAKKRKPPSRQRRRG